MATNQLQCRICGLVLLTIKLYVSHLRLVHAKDPNFNIMCGVNGCREVFRAFSAFSSHIYRHHREAIGIGSAIVQELESSTSPVHPASEYETESVAAAVCDPPDPVPSTTGAAPVNVEVVSRDMKEEAARFLLMLREGRQISQAAIGDVIRGCKSLYQRAIMAMKEKVLHHLAGAGVELPGLQDIFDAEYNPFNGIQTNHLFERFCIEHLGCLEPTEVLFGEEMYVSQFSGYKRRKVARSDKFYYVPILHTLQKLLSLEEFQSEILNSHAEENENVLSDFCDGTLFQNHPLFSVDARALQIVAYYDELEIVNPIGSYVKKHKLGCLFFFLANVRPQYRSTYKAIHLVAVARSQDITNYGIDAFLTRFVEDLKVLYCDGICGLLNGEPHTYHGALIAFLADTLAAHQLGGFKGSMSFAQRICRTCMISPSQIGECFSDVDCQLRSPETHFEQCTLLIGPLQDHYSTCYGINRLSLLEEVPGFSVVTGLPHDIMHDLFEGVVPYELKLLIQHCVCSKYFTIDLLNQRINRYDFVNNKPTPIDTRIINSPMKIRQSASQMMHLSREFPMLTGDLIPVDDENWYSFLILLKICAIALSPLCTYDTISYLRVLIEEKLQLFKKLYPESNMIPKQHYMVHYPLQISRLGPLIQSWNMRQESKLSFIKRVSRQSNYKNVCLTAAKKHQFWLCHQMLSSELLTPTFDQSKKQQTCVLSEEEDYVQAAFLQILSHLTGDTTVSHPDWVALQSSQLRKGVFIILHYDLYKPVFGRIIDIAVIEKTVMLCVLEFYGHFFKEHFNSFEITHHGVLKAVHLDLLHDHRPVYARHSFVNTDKHLYISLPYIQ